VGDSGRSKCPGYRVDTTTESPRKPIAQRKAEHTKIQRKPGAFGLEKRDKEHGTGHLPTVIHPLKKDCALKGDDGSLLPGLMGNPSAGVARGKKKKNLGKGRSGTGLK